MRFLLSGLFLVLLCCTYPPARISTSQNNVERQFVIHQKPYWVFSITVTDSKTNEVFWKVHMRGDGMETFTYGQDFGPDSITDIRKPLAKGHNYTLKVTTYGSVMPTILQFDE